METLLFFRIAHRGNHWTYSGTDSDSQRYPETDVIGCCPDGCSDSYTQTDSYAGIPSLDYLLVVFVVWHLVLVIYSGWEEEDRDADFSPQPPLDGEEAREF